MNFFKDSINSAPASSRNGALFEEPFDIPTIATIVLHDNRFYMSAYIYMGLLDRWKRGARQLRPLFMEFMRAEIPDERLCQLTALMFRWTGRFDDESCRRARKYLANNLDFLSKDRMQVYIDRHLVKGRDGGMEWRDPPWQPR